MNPLDYRTHMDSYGSSQGLEGLIGAVTPKSDKADRSDESPSESFADAVNGADTEKRAERVPANEKASAKAAAKQVQKPEPKTAAADKTKDTEAADQKADQAAGSTSQDYVAAYGALVPADTTKTTKGGDALTSLADVKPEHEVSENFEGSGATLSPAAITVQLGAGAVNFNKTDAGATDGAATASTPGNSHLLPVDELTALIDGTAPAQKAATATQQAANTGKAVSDAVKAAAGNGVQTAEATGKAAVAQTPAADAKAKHQTGIPAQGAPAAQVADIQAASAAPGTPADTAGVAVADAMPADATTDGQAAAAPDAPAAAPVAQPSTDGTAIESAIVQAAATDGTDKNTEALGAVAGDSADTKVPPLVAAQAKAEAAAKAQAANPAAQAAKQTAENHPAAAQAVHQAAGAQEATKSAGHEVAQDKTTDTADFKTLLQGGSAQAVGQQMTARAIDQSAASAFGQQMGSGTQRDPSPALTPEQLVGQSAGSSHDAVAGGLSNLRGQPSFMESMSLLGGRPSATLAANVAQQFNMQVSKAVMSGEQQFTVRLDPAELGRLEVKLHFTKDGEVRARIAAERPETLQLLQRDAKGLEKALTSGGQRVEQGGISFSLDNSDQQSAGRAFAEAAQQEKMRADLAARSASRPDFFAGAQEEQVPLENILPHVSAATGVDISV